MIKALALILAALICCAAAANIQPAVASDGRAINRSIPAVVEGPVQTARILVGPFDLHRKYRSMEGPYVIGRLRVADLVFSGQVVVPESMVTFIEVNSQGAPSMNGPSMSTSDAQNVISAAPLGLIDTGVLKRELYWLKGIKLEVLDENDKPLPTAEFICHLNLDVDPRFRTKVFPQAEPNTSSRLITLTQGQTEFRFPEGFAVPVASDELWTFTFQAANRTSDGHRRVKHLCTLEFISDKDLRQPLKALHWYNPYIAVVLDKGDHKSRHGGNPHGPSCLAVSEGEGAANMVVGTTIKDPDGKRLTGHWAIPPGRHTYRTPVTDQRLYGFAAKERKIHAVWSHVHPLCTQSSLLLCDGSRHKKIFTAQVKTKTRGGLELVHIDNIISPAGIPLLANQHYELEATYSNNTRETQDSMVALGVFFEDQMFVKPDWLLSNSSTTAVEDDTEQTVITGGKDGVYCGIKSSDSTQSGPSAQAASVESELTARIPLFNPSADGPLLTEPRVMEIETSKGNIHVVLDPALAPQHATQLYKLLRSGVFEGTPIYRYEPNFVLQVANAETKAGGKAQMSAELFDLLRRLPLEVAGQETGKGLNRKWALSMARYDTANSAVSSFSILLDNEPHLDHNYTVFGNVIPDDLTIKTIETIKQQWSDSRPVITGAREIAKSLASVVPKE